MMRSTHPYRDTMKHNDWIKDPDTGEWCQLMSLRRSVVDKVKEYAGPVFAVLAMGFFVYVLFA